MTRRSLPAPTRWVVLLAFLAVAWFWLGSLSAATLAVLVLALYYAAAGTSFNVLFGSLGVFSLAQPVFVAVGGYTSAYLYTKFELSPWLSMLIAMAISAVIAVPVGFIAMRRPGTVVTALVTLILAEATPPVLSAIKPLGGSIGLYIPVRRGTDWTAMQFPDALPFARILLVMNVVFIAGLMWYSRSKWGDWTTAIRDSEVAARAVGIPVLGVRLGVFVAAAMIASLPGVVYAQYNLLTNSDLFLGTSALFQVLVVALVGGSGRPWGTLVGAVIMTEISYHLSQAAGGRPGIGPLTFAGAFLVMALVLPRGISGAWAQLVSRGTPAAAGPRPGMLPRRPAVAATASSEHDG
jgi:branched-chain amino acid transport system permease protein